MARDDMLNGLDSRPKRTSGPAHHQQQQHNNFAKQLQDGAGPPATAAATTAATTAASRCGATPLLPQGNPGQHSNDGTPALRKTKRSLEAADASGRPLAVVQLFDNLQQPSTWEVSPWTKHEVERLLRSDVSSRLVLPALQTTHGPAQTSPTSTRKVERRRTKTALRQQQTRSAAAAAKTQARDLPSHADQNPKPNSTTTNSPAKSEQMPDTDVREKHDIRHTVQFEIGDDDAFQKFCETTFNDLQQLAMKTILKAWIKELEPKKQKRYPYCRTEKTGHPEWWPAPQVPHKEPDHLSKSERSKLAMTIIWYAMQPKFNGQGVNRLEDSTRSCKLEYESDKHWMPERRQTDLKQLYAVARKRYMFQNDEMDSNDLVSVSCLYKEPGRKRYRHRPTPKVNVDLSTPQTESSSQEHRQDEDSPPSNVQLRQLPASVAETNGMTSPEPPTRQPYAPSMTSTFEQSSFRPQQRESFSSVVNPQHHYMHPIPGTQAFQYFEPPPMQWQPTAVASGISPVTPQDPVNSSFDSSFVMDIPWPSPASITPLLLSTLQPNSASASASLPHTTTEELYALDRSTNGMNVDVTSSIHAMVEPYNGSTRENMSGDAKYDRRPLENSAENMARFNSEDLFHRSQDPQPWMSTPRVCWTTTVPCYQEPSNTDP